MDSEAVDGDAVDSFDEPVPGPPPPRGLHRRITTVDGVSIRARRATRLRKARHL